MTPLSTPEYSDVESVGLEVDGFPSYPVLPFQDEVALS
jgi:hypothetical protein